MIQEEKNLMGNQQQEQAQHHPQNQEKQLKKSDKLALILDSIFHSCKCKVGKTRQCKHQGSCLCSLIVASLKSLILAYGIKTLASLIFSIKKVLTKPHTIKQILMDKTPISFGLFLGSFTFLFRGIVCIFRRHLSQEKQKYTYLFAGFVSGILSILFLEKSSRQALGLFLLARAIDFSYQSLVKKGYLPEFKYFYVLLYSVMMYGTGYCYMNEPGSLSPETSKFYNLFINGNLNDMLMRKITIERKNNYLATKGIQRQNPEDYIPLLAKYYKKQGK